MPRLIYTAWLLLCLAPMAWGQTLTLSASRPNPFVGEVVTLTLEISQVTATEPLELAVPWWKTHTGWQESELSWIERHRGTIPAGLKLRAGRFTVHAPAVKPGVYQLQWTIVVPEPKEDQPITFGSVTVGTVRSNVLTLEPRRPPPLLASPAVWNLGLGRYQVTARWSPDTVALGDETTLEITVSGEGNRFAITQPALGNYPGWEGTKLLSEAAGSVFGASSRVLSYRVRPRQMDLALPPLAVTWFDPVREVQVNERVTLPALKVTGARAVVVKPGHTVADARRHLSESLQEQLKLYERKGEPQGYRVLQRLMTVLPWVPLGWILFLMGHMALHRFAPVWMEQRRKRQLMERYERRLLQSPGNAEDERQQLLQFISELHREPRHLLDSIDPQVTTMLATLDRWQFGAPPQEIAKLLREQQQAFLASCREGLR
jgi:hypothetical protein